MLEINQQKPRRMLSYSEKAGSENNNDLMCYMCWSDNRFTGFHDKLVCPTHGEQVKGGIGLSLLEKTVKFRGIYENILSRRKKMNQGNGPIIVYEDRNREYQRLLNQVRANIVTKGADLGDLKEQAAQVITEIALMHKLSPFNGEISCIPIVKDKKVVGVVPYVGISGWIRTALDQSFYHIYPDQEIIIGSEEPDKIERMGLTICRKCQGKAGEKCVSCGGSGWWGGGKGKPCYKCGGQDSPPTKGTGKVVCANCANTGKIPPENFIVVELRLMRMDRYEKAISLAEKATSLGLEPLLPEPVVGRGVWQIGENVPSTWQPLQVAEKRSLMNALRKAYSLPVIFNASVPMLDEPVEGSVVSGHVIEADSYEVAQLNDAIGVGAQDKGAEDVLMAADDTPIIIKGDEIAAFIKLVKATGYEKPPIELLTDIFGEKYDFSNLTNIAAANALACLGAGLTKEARIRAAGLTQKARIWPKN